MIYTTEEFNTKNFAWGKCNFNIRKVKNPILIPPKKILGEKSFIGGMADSKGNIIQEANMWRERGPSKPPKNIVSLNKPVAKNSRNKIIYGDYTYLGGAYDHYGHFLLESLARVPLDKENRDSTIWLNVYNNRYTGYMEYILNALKINPYSITQITQVNGIVSVPQPRVVIGSYFNKLQVKIYEEILNNALVAKNKKTYPRKLYVSRSKILHDTRKILNEIEIENHLSKRGFKICHMQDIPFEEQILHMYNAETVIGFAGSAMHSLVFCNDSVRSIFLYKDEFILPNYISQDYMLDRSSLYINISNITHNDKVNIKRLMNTIDEII